jgi:hypothetical protein
MRGLSLRQPFAELLASGRKTIELRNWNTRFRGEFLIHASKTVDLDACRALKIKPETLATGAIIGMAFLYDVKEYKNRGQFRLDARRHMDTGGYRNDRYGFMVRNAVKFDRPIPAAGRLNFFEVKKE